ncbi:AarF/ABC1/UbiB kinase family protein [Rhodoferax sp. U11-2br]|uniref:ABC1 kinase family protein n=1 Tax=Rhodoferax sp. U11-2br TaxID=2838878 RepID=UPI001BEC96C5|nr:AarF/ABC1/UbiB kinase family protein [Rhodoferax sp. U11-2br]MBT3069079.1 AarF/ABC1/UbiB kinase family protein [Rhodoferax sp. U11-2br]
MPHSKFESKALAVPSGRLSRLARFGGMASNIAGGMLLDGARQLAQGKRPSVSDLLLTPANAIKVTHQLAQLRGAAMKVGQLLSMDAGDMLPPELAEILGRLRSEGHHMPQSQLNAALNAHWGSGWQQRFETFLFQPIAAASIGQVHRATTKDGRELAIKIQYPGVRRSIDSDVDNVASLMRLSGVLPKTLNIAPMLLEAKRQLHQEADYQREGQYLQRFAELLADSPEFLVPKLHADFTTQSVLAMDFVDGVPIESLVDAPQEERDRLMTLLIGLLFRELFEFALMQTDPNFANYRYNTHTKQLILLDFGATRVFPPEMAPAYRQLMQAGLAGDRAGARQAMINIGFFDEQTLQRHQDAVVNIFELSLEPLIENGDYDFGNTDVALRLRDAGMAIGEQRDFWHIPPMDTLFLQRKFGGVYMLASRLKARVNVRALMEKYLSTSAA